MHTENPTINRNPLLKNGFLFCSRGNLLVINGVCYYVVLHRNQWSGHTDAGVIFYTLPAGAAFPGAGLSPGIVLVDGLKAKCGDMVTSHCL